MKTIQGTALAAIAVSAFTLHSTSGRLAAQDEVPHPVLDMNQVDKFAWELFVYLGRSADNGTNDVIWETWATMDDVFGDPNTEPEWPAAGVSPERVLSTLPSQQDAFREHMVREGLIPNDPQPEFLPPSGGSEVRMNKAAFDYVVANDLYNIDGQEKAFENGMKIDLPSEAKEIKAVWKEIAEADKPRFHWQPYNNRLYGLIALHITTKDLPQWFWATYEHKDNPRMGAVIPSQDDFGLGNNGQLNDTLKQMMTDAGMGDHWKNYRLNGSQVEFTDTTGRPTLLANSIIEAGFESQSSCTTCHARATIGPRIQGTSGANRLNFFPAEIGTPNPDWFFNSATSPPTRNYLQMDFVWSFFRARRKTN